MSETKQQTAVDKAAEARRAYYKEYRARNREKIKEWQERYWKKKALQAAERADQ